MSKLKCNKNLSDCVTALLGNLVWKLLETNKLLAEMLIIHYVVT